MVIERKPAEAMLRALHEHNREQVPAGELAGLIHPQAEMRLLITFAAPLHGRDTIVAALRSARRNAALYSATIRRFEWLDDHTVLTFGRGRYALPEGGYAEGRLFWLDEFREGLIYRSHVFMREAGARAAYEDRFEGRTQADQAN